MAYETTAAVRERLRAERKARGWDIPRMARELRDAAEHPHRMPSVASLVRNIERWEAGVVRRISERYRLLYGRALRMPDDELFGTGPAGPPPPAAAEGDSDAIRAMLSALLQSDRQFGGRHVRNQAAEYLTTVIEPRLRGSVPGRLRRSLFSVSTEFALRVSAMHLDTDQTSPALAALARAAGMAGETGDPSLTAWVLARRGEVEIHQATLARDRAVRHAAVEQAIAYTEGAAALARSAAPLARAFLVTKAALAWSMAGDRARAQQHIGVARDAAERAGTVDEPEWMGPYSRAHLQHEEARCFANLGMGRDAVTAAADALEHRPVGRPRAFTLGLVAIGHAQRGDVEAACAAGHELLTVARGIPSRRVAIRVAEVAEALHPFRAASSVRELREATAAFAANPPR
jgi:transcriptional regulator with XRE-family HTH domain